jgi:hypothetical protein
MLTPFDLPASPIITDRPLTDARLCQCFLETFKHTHVFLTVGWNGAVHLDSPELPHTITFQPPEPVR